MDNTVSVYIRNTDKTYEFPIGISLGEILQTTGIKTENFVFGVTVNNVLRDFSYRIFRPKSIEFIDVISVEGFGIYSRTLWMVAAKAAHNVADAEITIEQPVKGGFFCTSSREVTDKFISNLRDEINNIAEANYPIILRTDRTVNVIKRFEEVVAPDTISVLSTLGKEYTDYYEIDGYIDYYPSVLAPSTSYVGPIDVQRSEDGFILVAPDPKNGLKPFEVGESHRTYLAHREFRDWNRMVGMRDVGDFNRICQNGGVRELIKISESLHEKKIASIAEKVLERKPKFVMIAGPSSSGKTTFSKRLDIQMKVCGIKPLVLSLDNFFKDREFTPRDEKGDYDFEHLEALDLKLLNDTLQRLLKGEEVELPTYNFAEGRKEYKGEKMKLKEGNVIVMEGIHALNPDMLPKIPTDLMFRIFAAPMTPIAFNDHNWLSHMDIRLIRRIVRDHNFRAYSAQNTIRRWPSVLRGEMRWIYPFVDNADYIFNSALLYELAVMKPYAEPLLRQVPEASPEFAKAHELLEFLSYFYPVFDKELPPTSLLREFLGGSSFHY